MVSWLKIEDALPGDLTSDEARRVKEVLSQVKITVQPRMDDRWADYFKQVEWPQNTALVCDNNTWAALGEVLCNELKAAGYRITLINLGSRPHADEARLDYVRTHANACRAIIGVGSGTVNDLCKMAAFQLDVPYAIVGTAASMNGYLSANAAIMHHGHKQSLPARLPALALFDLDVLSVAPIRLKRAGLGDAICRSTAQFDWLLSHLLLDTHYDPLPFKLLLPHEEAMMQGDAEALILTLLLSGLGMTLSSGSFPASEGEHLLAHYIEMKYPEIAHAHLHGEHIAVTTLHMAQWQAKLLNRRTPPDIRTPPDKATCLTHFGDKTGSAVWQEWQQKQAQLEKLHLAQAGWQEIQAQLKAVHVPPERLEQAHHTAGAPTAPEQIGWSDEMLHEAFRYAHLIRNRLTALDFI